MKLIYVFYTIIFLHTLYLKEIKIDMSIVYINIYTFLLIIKALMAGSCLMTDITEYKNNILAFI